MSEAVEITPVLLRAWALPQPEPGGDKNSRGRVLIVGGWREVPGAALLAALGAMRAGAGKLQVATGESVAVPLGLAMPEARVIGLEEGPDGLSGALGARLPELASGADAVLVGPGLLNGKSTGALACAVLALAGETRAVIDAGALCELPALKAALRARPGPAVLTPHAGELASLLGREKTDVEADPVAAARSAAAEIGAVVVLKGAVTQVAAPDGRLWVNRRGHDGLGVSGSGDVLGGVLAGLLARGAAPEQAACWAVHLHAVAGERLAASVGAAGYLARELTGEIPAVLETFR